MKDLKPIRGLRHLQELIDQGEHEHQDFKFLISDARKIARSISAFANNDGGRLLIGVKDNGTIAGVRSEEDLYMIEQAATMYCRPEIEIEFKAIKAGSDGVVFIATIPKSMTRPVCVVEEKNRLLAYYRVADENIVAHPLMVKAWRYRDSGTMSMSAGEEEYAILDCLRKNHPATYTDTTLALESHMSNATANRVITRLAAMGLVEFVYDGHEFKIALPREDDAQD